MDGLYYDKNYEKGDTGVGLLFKRKHGGWWIDVEDYYSINNTLCKLINDTSDCWLWKDKDHEDHILVLPWKPLLEWQS